MSKELIERLRGDKWMPSKALNIDAADLIEQQQREIEELKGECLSLVMEATKTATQTRLYSAEKLIEQLVKALSGVMPFTINGSVECKGDKCRERWCLSCNAEEDVNEAVAEAHNSFDAVKEALAAAKQWKEGV